MSKPRPSRQEMYADDPKFLWKLILRALAIVLAIAAIGLLGWSLAHQLVLPGDIYDSYDNAYYEGPSDIENWFLPWEFITLGLSVAWNAANIVVLLARGRPIHPGANVACDLLLWLGLIVTGIFAMVGAENYFYWYPSDYDESSSFTTYPNGTETVDPCEAFTSCAAQNSYTGTVTRKAVTIAVGAGIGFIVLLMHFALFISACRYTNARRVRTQASAIAEKMYTDRVAAGEERNPNAGFVPISEPVEQQAPLDYGMPPAPTGMTVGERGKGRGTRHSYEQPEVVVGGKQGRGTMHSYEQPEVVVGGKQGRGTMHSYEQPEVVVEGGSGAHAMTADGDDFHNV